MALTVDDQAVRPLTASEVLRMVELGVLPEDERVELLDGVLVEKPVKSAGHALVQSRLLRWLAPVTDRYRLWLDAPLIVPDETYLPEPDDGSSACPVAGCTSSPRPRTGGTPPA